MTIVTLLVLAAHEAVHFLVLPKSINERGFGVFAGGAFVTIRGKMTRNRSLVVLLAPVIALTGGPLVWTLVIGPVHERIIWASSWNGAESIFDLIFSVLLLRQVPHEALLHFGTGVIRFDSRRGGSPTSSSVFPGR